MFTDPSFSTPQGGDLKGVNSPTPRPPPSAAFTAGGAGEPARGSSAGASAPNAGSPALTFPPSPTASRPLLVALAGFLPKTSLKPPQIQGNQAKPPAAHHSTTATTTPTTTARLARSPGAAPALAGKPPESALSWTILAGTPANAACTDSHTAHHALHPTHPWPASPITHPGTTSTPTRASTPTTSSTRWKYGS